MTLSLSSAPPPTRRSSCPTPAATACSVDVVQSESLAILREFGRSALLSRQPSRYPTATLIQQLHLDRITSHLVSKVQLVMPSSASATATKQQNVEALSSSIVLPCGLKMGNRLVKAAMEEMLGTSILLSSGATPSATTIWTLPASHRLAQKN